MILQYMVFVKKNLEFRYFEVIGYLFTFFTHALGIQYK